MTATDIATDSIYHFPSPYKAIPTKFKATKFRSKETTAILNAEIAEPNTFNLNKWTDLAIEDISKVVHLRDTGNGNQKRTWHSALADLVEGMDLFADAMFPEAKSGQRIGDIVRAGHRDQWEARMAFCRTRLNDILFMAKFNA